jgi:hypothetical protein
MTCSLLSHRLYVLDVARISKITTCRYVNHAALNYPQNFTAAAQSV